LLAPATGEETREYLAQRAREGRDRAAEAARQGRDRAAEVARQGRDRAAEAARQGRDMVNRQKESLTTAFDRARDQFQKSTRESETDA
jgi:gas vesicle protein